MTTLMSVLHGGDLGLGGLVKLLVYLFFLLVVPLFLIGFIIYKVASRK